MKKLKKFMLILLSESKNKNEKKSKLLKLLSKKTLSALKDDNSIS
jgi:hypothetical protein